MSRHTPRALGALITPLLILLAAAAAGAQTPDHSPTAPTGAAAPTAPGATGTSGESAQSGSAGATSATPETGAESAAQPTGAPAPTGAAPATGPSEAERLLGVRKLLESDRAEQERLKSEQASAETDFNNASDVFLRIDTRLTTDRENLAAATDADQKAKLAASLARHQQMWTDTKNRLDLAIQRRKALREQLSVLIEKIALEQQILDKMISLPPLPATSAPAGGALGGTGASGSSGTTGSTTPPSTPAAPAVSPLSALLGLPLPAAQAAKPADTTVLLDPRLLQAQKDVVAREAELTDAENSVKLLDRGLDIFQRDIASSRDVLQNTQLEADAAAKRIAQADQRLQAKKTAGADASDLTRTTQRRDQTQKQLDDDRQTIVRQAKRIAESQTMLENLRTIREQAVGKVADAQSAVQSARTRVAFLESPLAPHQLVRWFVNKGPRVLAVLVAMLLFWWLAHLIGGRLVQRLLRRGHQEHNTEHASRAETLRRVFESTAGVAIITLGVLAALSQAGIDVTVLLGGAAVLGAAVAFGSQNLIKDYFAGFMILVENQYSVGNVINIGGTTGTVEDITLRMTSIRDLEGVVHFIPHNQVTSVSNLTYGWSRVVLDINIASASDVDRAMAAIVETARELKSDERLGPDILGDPQMLGVDAISGAAVDVKLLIKTRPLRRWPVKREFLRRLKKRFDAAGIKLA